MVSVAVLPNANGRLFGALGFTFKDGKIAEIDLISDPEHLRHVDLTALGS